MSNTRRYIIKKTINYGNRVEEETFNLLDEFNGIDSNGNQFSYEEIIIDDLLDLTQEEYEERLEHFLIFVGVWNILDINTLKQLAIEESLDCTTTTTTTTTFFINLQATGDYGFITVSWTGESNKTYKILRSDTEDGVYTEIFETPLNQYTYIDDNKGDGLTFRTRKYYKIIPVLNDVEVSETPFVKD